MWFLKHLVNSIIKPGRGQQVFVGVSGGVDSSVAALLLKLYGYNVSGVFIRTWQPDWIECTWQDERRDAMRVCAHLEIPFIELNLEDEYKKGVADYMIAEYKKGRTPNPDVMCNKEVKFGGFLKWALQQGAHYVATGHYAQNISGKLTKGIDQSKDQSYFLWTITDQQLKHVLFPVGHLPKKIVRKIASWYQLPTAVKKDSQGICFIGEIDMKEFLKHYIQEEQGKVIDESGKVIGHHDGVLFYTLGERHGFTILEKGTNDAPYYVVSKDINQNTLTVSQSNNSFSGSQEIVLTNCVWRNNIQDKKYTAQIRYHGEQKTCHLKQINDSGCYIVFDEHDNTIAPGQSVVVYNHSECVGGGIVA